MKKNILLIFVIIFGFSAKSMAQTPNGTVNLGILSSFQSFTGAGGVANGNGATVIGDVGSNFGAITGNFTGNMYNADAVTEQARKDLLRLYIHINDKFVDFPSTHGPAFTGTLNPGVYSTDGAGSIGGTLTLDGGGDPDAFFIIKFNGALTVSASAVVNLINGTKSCNVFYIANGAISVAANSNLKGTLFSKVGAVGLGANVELEGRMLTMDGAITIGVQASASLPPCDSTIPIFCETDCIPAPAVDVLGVVADFALYTNLGAVANTAISGINGKIGTNSGAISGYSNGIHIGTEHAADALTSQASIDLGNAYTALMALPNTVVNHAPAFGSGETITGGVYYINGAGSLAGTITLDGQNDPNAIFVFKFAGAFNVAALTKTILINGAKRCNIFWIGGAGVTTGAVNIGAASMVKGTFLSHGGACNSGAGVFLAGRQLSTNGAINTNTGVLYNSPECITSVSLDPVYEITLVKTASIGGTGSLGDVITYTFTVENTGNTALTNVVITDPMTGLALTGSPIASLAVGTSDASIIGTYTITQSDIDAGSITNSATTSSDEGATDTSGTANDNDTATITTINQTSAIALIKTASVGGTGSVGDVITYTFTLENTGTTTLTNVIVTDPMTGLTFSGSTITSLEVGASDASITGTYTITQSDIDTGSITNSATVYSDQRATDTSGTTNDNDTPTITEVVSPIVAVADTINGTAGETNVINVLINDTLKSLPIDITEVNLTTVTPNSNLTLNDDGSINIALNTPEGIYTLIYQICEKLNPNNCDTATVTITVVCEQIDISTIIIIQPTCTTDTGSIVVTDPTGAGLTYSIDNSNYQSEPTFSNLAPGNYEVTAKNASGCNSNATSITINDVDEIVISKVVTANGDQWNEFFTVEGAKTCGSSVEVKIFNRWGAKIYETKNYQNDWNGFTHKNSVGGSAKVPTGTYYYIINLIESGLEPFAGPIYVVTK